MLLTFVSILLSIGIVAFTFLQATRLFGAYRHTIAVISNLDNKLKPSSNETAFKKELHRLLDEEDLVGRDLVQTLWRTISDDPIQTASGSGWVIDLDYLCDGKRYFRIHHSYEVVQTMPGLLTGLGILFTFSGLAVGISGLDPTNSSQLTAGVKTLLGGMSVAFLTSISGIFCALLWTWRHKSIMGDFETAFFHLYQTLHEKRFLFSPDERDNQIMRYQSDQTLQLSQLETTFKKALIAAFEELGGNPMAGGGAQQAGPDTSPLLEKIGRELSVISAGYSEISQLSRDMGGVFDRLLKERQQMLDQQHAAGAESKQMVHKAVSVAASFEEIQQAQSQTATVISEGAVELKKVLNLLRQTSTQMTKNQQVLISHTERLEQNWNTSRGHMEQLHKLLKSDIETFHNRLGESLRGVHGEIDEILAKSMRHFETGLKEFGQMIEILAIQQKTGETPPEDTAKSSSWLGKRR
ncbi:hypothetical protein [Acanthopleuribacter pedis]|uniref:MotA/TolQ/ExbB proton channel domain-containing protein n=1 Tax=Acanthopleuribacter pedis TaxID=442870 RepID=A0A8J7Q2F4_9BACT|nr:hypothetical protein [Acanthopleuribacter pedis]MBO1317022.1 hypothetical protein [Acanthopleuribacter pedis]